jgi:hypothetical protein
MQQLADELAKLADAHNAFRTSGAWYGQARDLAPGVGVIFNGIPYPLFNPETGRYQVTAGLVLILTHECDIDQNNVRAMNRGFLIAPLIQMSAFAQNFSANDALKDNARSLARDIAANLVNRLMYLPPPADLLRVTDFPLGAFIYFNAITNADISHLTAPAARPVCALSEIGLEFLDRKLQNHLFRPKAEQLPRTL